MSAVPIADDVLDPNVTVLPLQDVANALERSTNKVLQMLREGQLLAIKRDGDVMVPADFLNENGVIKGLAGTITVLSDAGFDRTETVRWLYSEDDTLPGTSPVQALRKNHGAEVKRRAQALAF